METDRKVGMVVWSMVMGAMNQGHMNESRARSEGSKDRGVEVEEVRMSLCGRN